MKISFKSVLAVAAFAAFATSSCSQQEQNKAEATTENAADAVTNTTENALDSAKADMATEPGDTAVVQNKEADKIVEETPATKQN